MPTKRALAAASSPDGMRSVTSYQGPVALIASIGDAIAIPLKWSNSAAIASLEDGYELSAKIGLDDLSVWANQRFNAASSSGFWTGNATELWLCLYYEHRRWRHFSENPDGASVQLLDGLCTGLQQAIVGAIPTTSIRPC